MKSRSIFHAILMLVSVSLVFISCKKDPEVTEPDQDYGRIVLKFTHHVSNQPLITDSIYYLNAAGNNYGVQEIQYFISDITLNKATGGTYTITDKNGIHYIDTDIPSTHTWNVADAIPATNYSSVSFTFGISESKNQSNMFVNPPESNMFWPEFLGGGYHYLKFNGQWIDTVGSTRLFNYHLGIGQIYGGGVITPDSIKGFVQNYFTLTLPASSFVLDSAGTREIEIVMQVDSWLDTPHAWDFNDAVNYGWSIMQSQIAMQAAKENGADVFKIGHIQ
jgi:hypothetical protein